MALISDYVDVTVTRGSRPLDAAGFGTPLFLANVNLFGAGELTRTYSSVTELTDGGFPANHPAVLYATQLFGQDNAPNNLVVGKATYASYDVTPTANSEELYTVNAEFEDKNRELNSDCN